MLEPKYKQIQRTNALKVNDDKLLWKKDPSGEYFKLNKVG